MKGGFSFCGVDIENLGLTYVPEMSETYAPFAGADISVSALNEGTTDGGYFYGTTLKSKEFTLRCIFEDRDIRKGNLARIENVFSRGKTGRLVFKNHDWLWYTATVTQAVNTDKLTNYMNGFVTIKMIAFYPFGRSDYLEIPANVNPESHPYKDMLLNSAILKHEDMPVPQTSFANTVNNATVYVYNPGNETAKCAIQMKHNALNSGVTITNLTTGQKCEVAGLVSDSKLLVVDGLNGKTVVYEPGSTEPTLGFLYHRGGFIDLAPAGNIIRNINIRKTGTNTYVMSNSSSIEQDEYAYLVGKWIVYRGNCMKITGVSNNTLTVKQTNNLTLNEDYSMNIVDNVNEIVVSKKAAGTWLDSFDIKYKATFR